MKLLLVDDEKTIQKMLSTLLARKGFQVIGADSGAAGLDSARREKPDLVISDIMMPDMDGFQFRRAMLEDASLRDIPFIFYSGKYASEKSLKLAEKLGVSRFISKPASNEDLFSAIEQILDEQQIRPPSPSESMVLSREEFAKNYQEVLLERVLETNQELETAHKSQQVMNNLLHLTLLDLTLQELLEGLLDQIISFPWFDLLPKGAIFIVQDKELVLKAHRGLNPALLDMCGKLSFGSCLCGRSAESGEIIFADHVDERHDVTYPGIQPHGHYCVPIKTGSGKVLGVFTLYIREGTARRPEVEDSLKNAARTAASIIMRKMKEEELKQYYAELNALNTASNKLLLRNKDGESLLDYICRVACTSFNLNMVWLGFRDERNTLQVASSCGKGVEYLDSLNLRCDHAVEGLGPSCLAVKTGKPVACNDIEHDPMFAPWRDKALACGFRSSLAVPLIAAEQGCRGALNMYSYEKDFFNPERRVILTAYVNNVVALLDNEELIESLEEKVKARTIELERARNLAQAADRAKSSFLANMSHELRTPLNSILGFTDIMLQGLSGKLLPEQREYLNDIHDSGKHLLSLVNDILDLSKIEADMIELEYNELSLADVVTRSLYMVREKAIRHNITISTEIPQDLPLVEADERRIRQVVVNLLVNSVKFSPDGGEVRIVAKAFSKQESPQKTGATHVILSVADSGPGIAAEDQAKLFKPFMQLDSGMSREMEGTGLGLALSKRIIEQHNGRIFFSSEPGEGSVFSFIVPVRRSSVTTGELPVAFLPWPIFYLHVERILSMADRTGSTCLILKQAHAENGKTPGWSEIVLALNGRMRTHECFSLEPAESSLYFMLLGQEPINADGAAARIADVLREIGIEVSFRCAKYPEDGKTTAEMLYSLGYSG